MVTHFGFFSFFVFVFFPFRSRGVSRVPSKVPRHTRNTPTETSKKKTNTADYNASPAIELLSTSFGWRGGLHVLFPHDDDGDDDACVFHHIFSFAYICIEYYWKIYYNIQHDLYFDVHALRRHTHTHCNDILCLTKFSHIFFCWIVCVCAKHVRRLFISIPIYVDVYWRVHAFSVGGK